MVGSSGGRKGGGLGWGVEWGYLSLCACARVCVFMNYFLKLCIFDIQNKVRLDVMAYLLTSQRTS